MHCAVCINKPSLPPKSVHSESLVWLWAAGRRCHGHSGPELDQRGAAAQVCDRGALWAQVRTGSNRTGVEGVMSRILFEMFPNLLCLVSSLFHGGIRVVALVCLCSTMCCRCISFHLFKWIVLCCSNLLAGFGKCARSLLLFSIKQGISAAQGHGRLIPSSPSREALVAQSSRGHNVSWVCPWWRLISVFKPLWVLMRI